MLVPDWLTKAGLYLTDRGTLIRIGVFVGGAAIGAAALFILIGKPAVGAATTVVKAVK